MARMIQGWLEFNGRKSDEFGVRLMDGANYARPEWRGTAENVDGRDGDLWQTDGTYGTVEIKRKMRCRMSRLDEVAAWLTGSGLLRFSWTENRAYEARAAKAVSFDQVSVDSDPLMEFTAAFTCQPFRRMLPEIPPFAVTNGEIITNPGTAPSLPRVTVTGSGDFSVTIGLQTIFFQDVDGGIIIDSELGDALTPDGALLANDRISGELFRMQPGANIVSWLIDTGGSVSGVTIEPRWRCL